MSWRVVIISNQAKLDYKMGYMVVRGKETYRILIDEIETLVLENPVVSLTGCLIEVLTQKKVKVIFCDSKRNPTAELIPHHGSHDSTSKIRTQVAWDKDIKAEIWREIISEKIRKQSQFLRFLGKGKESTLLESYIGQVEMMDATNREGHAAKVYFNALFGMDFTRSALNPVNAALNYGYSMILSAFNRDICANGYLTQLGIFHNNMFNHFNLSCDFMEPYRILVDREVYKLQPQQFESDDKHALWKLMDQKVIINDTRQTVNNAIKIFTRSVFEAINDADVSELLFFEIEE